MRDKILALIDRWLFCPYPSTRKYQAPQVKTGRVQSKQEIATPSEMKVAKKAVTNNRLFT